MHLAELLSHFASLGGTEVLFKPLAPNDNTKNQIYLAGDLGEVGKIPGGEVLAKTSTSTKSGVHNAIFQVPLDFWWLSVETRRLSKAPHAKLIAYPQYPEVRFSGFLRGAAEAPSELLSVAARGREPGRVLMLAPLPDRRVIGAVFDGDSPVARELRENRTAEPYGGLRLLSIGASSDGRVDLLRQLARIHALEWIDSCRLRASGERCACSGPNCGGYTLEAEFGIRPNGYSEPDYRGWELKQHGVQSLARPRHAAITLLTPEPDGGLYADAGAESFVRKFGYGDRKGRADRLNFGGIYRCNAPANSLTGARLVLDGYSQERGLFDAEGALRLLGSDSLEAASWSFAKLMAHWRRKHAKTAFVPSERRLAPRVQYRFGRNVALASEPSFLRLLKAIDEGVVYYDPALKIESASTSDARKKARSQFRVRSSELPSLYGRWEEVDVVASAGLS